MKANAQHLARFRNKWTAALTVDQMEHPVGRSMAVPDCSYSIRDLVSRMAGNADSYLSKLVRDGDFAGDDEEVTHDDPDMRELRTGDLFEQEQIISSTRHRVTEAKAQLAASKEGRKKDARKDGAQPHDAPKDDAPTDPT